MALHHLHPLGQQPREHVLRHVSGLKVTSLLQVAILLRLEVVYRRYRSRQQIVPHVKPPPLVARGRQTPEPLEKRGGERRRQHLHGARVDVVRLRVRANPRRRRQGQVVDAETGKETRQEKARRPGTDDGERG
eukprot:CAMPEP_0182480502 /NCGR_PEP_ID=MMETSP1319-20130603/35857_1 /TAXON_ID=172717 /ORGANISM="Bolidomonas pacifica, Strain RCC208" /LENGTH=132 /DNA_ID=CAMNT_0024682005 /DNA_START=575 /DNA_END=973 /DNA_ORIENTATION=-